MPPAIILGFMHFKLIILLVNSTEINNSHANLTIKLRLPRLYSHAKLPLSDWGSGSQRRHHREIRGSEKHVHSLRRPSLLSLGLLQRG
ncbi:hypothetical protein CEXT_783951 [Caerostris extrusa]|uniref:Uncharacterized protein n=1 Tax=Caerostris extrusa TaxID=172846 RepID=A0AAV4NQZ6_CAEEX|nr:hypothetical protein CEXT_783951 [Caerostris extrusa]